MPFAEISSPPEAQPRCSRNSPVQSAQWGKGPSALLPNPQTGPCSQVGPNKPYFAPQCATLRTFAAYTALRFRRRWSSWIPGLPQFPACSGEKPRRTAPLQQRRAIRAFRRPTAPPILAASHPACKTNPRPLFPHATQPFPRGHRRRNREDRAPFFAETSVINPGA